MPNLLKTLTTALIVCICLGFFLIFLGTTNPGLAVIGALMTTIGFFLISPVIIGYITRSELGRVGMKKTA
jgi:multisubunit Na+/H+ antiporter MnhG subunit